MKRNIARSLLFLIILFSACQQQQSGAKNQHQRSETALPSSGMLISTVVTQVTTTGSMVDIQKQIQQTMNKLDTLYRTGEFQLISEIVDTKNTKFANMMRERYEQRDTTVKSRQITVKEIKPISQTLVQANLYYLEISTQQDYSAWWTFRFVDGAWKISEPTIQEQAGGSKVTTPFVTLQLNGYSASLANDFESTTIESLKIVKKAFPNLNVPPITVTVTASSDELRSASEFAIGSYVSPTSNKLAKIVIIDPRSYYVGLIEKGEWQKEYTSLIAHEFTHYITEKQYDISLRDVPMWMTEGIAEYVARKDDNSRVKGILQKELIPVISFTGQPSLSSLDWNTDSLKGYILSRAVTQYCIESYGGTNAYWRLLQSYVARKNYTTAISDAYNISVNEFNQRWFDWAKNKYQLK